MSVLLDVLHLGHLNAPSLYAPHHAQESRSDEDWAFPDGMDLVEQHVAAEALFGSSPAVRLREVAG